jgi:PAS domain S-box-containing protein
VSGQHSSQPTPPVSNVLFERLFEFLPDAVFVTDSDGLILQANQQAEAMFGHSRAQLIGQPVELLLPERLRSSHPRHRNAYLAQRHTRPM